MRISKFYGIEILLVTTAIILRQHVLVALPQGGKSSKMHATKPKRQPQFLRTYWLKSARSLHTELTHSWAKEILGNRVLGIGQWL
jgi:hypothetical protein